MALYLNTNKPLENYKKLYRSKYFVDKSLIIEKLNELIDTSDRYLCITRHEDLENQVLQICWELIILKV